MTRPLSPDEQARVDEFIAAANGICDVCDGHGWVFGREPQCDVWFLIRCPLCQPEVPR